MQKRCFKYLLVAAICSSNLSLIGCGQQANKNSLTDTTALKNEAKTVSGNFSDQTEARFDSTQVAIFFKKYPDTKIYQKQVIDFYRKRNYAYAWFEKGSLIEQADNLANRISNRHADAIYKLIPYLHQLDSLLHGADVAANQKQPDITTELMLTSQYFIFSKLAWQGMDDSVSRAEGWKIPRKKIKYDQYLDSLLREPANKSTAAEPVYRQYELLKAYLGKYRKLNATDKWVPIANPAKTLKTGDSSVTIALIKSRLFKLEDFKADTINTVYNDDLIAGLKHFQARHGILVTGLPDKATIANLNVSLKSRIKQILANMERSRWLPLITDTNYVAVNIPEYKLHVYHGDSLLWSCNVVVGQAFHPTSIFYGNIKYVVFSPYWNVPPSIVRKEIVPGMRKHRHYLKTENMEITGYADGLPVVRQKPGPKNSLGLVKFLFPNSYNIYLHDTPSKFLFNETSRAFSHGCIRVMEPVKLASFLLKNNTGWDLSKINQAMHAGKERYVTLNAPTPVFIAYFTAFIDRDNGLNFRKDIYNLDDRLTAMILSGDDHIK